MLELANKVVVITGASSGLGRAAAIEFARAGAKLVIAARRALALEETARLCHEFGSEVLIVVTDVTIEDDVRRLASQTLARFERLDVWVNNAGVTSFGLLEATPFEAHRRVFETNVYGAMFGARAALPIFRRQGRGVLINVGSTLSKVAQPFVPSYVISKFALRGLSEALRSELAESREIHVCTLLPYAMNTQHFEAAPNFIGRAPHALPPATTPTAAARALVSLAARPRRERHIPSVTLLGLALHQLFPRTVERIVQRVVSNWHFGDVVPRNGEGNLWRPSSEPARIGGARPPRIGLFRLAFWLLFGRANPHRVPSLVR
ncbi:MAG TPA: SDR family NAD(P)-dependent oxidoreductase [Polyangiaceae bacterium]|nr:SDR family NAD(P)-dependent oxidoreductase [Polyangiaceae bacterium]